MNQVTPSPPPFRSSSRRRQLAGIRNPRSFRSDPRRNRCHDIRRHTPSPNAACFTTVPRSNTPTIPSYVAVHSSADASVNSGGDLIKQTNKTPGWTGLFRNGTPFRNSPHNSPCPSPRLNREGRRRPRYNRRQEQEELQKRAEELALGKKGQESIPLKSPRAQRQRDRQQPRHPEESAPPSSHPASLAELSLPFRRGSNITDPVSRTHYTLLELIGRGAYALVWRARRSTDSALLALKCLSTKSLTPTQQALQLLEVELHARSYKQAPASVVPFYGSWKHPSAPWLWLCMGNCPSGDLYTWLTEGAGSSPSLLRPNCPTRRKYWLEILNAVREIHSIGVSHRDLKPENFLISAKNSILLGDFGLATTDTSSEDWECGSRPYMSPEVRNYPQPDLNSDHPVPQNSTPYMPHLADTWSLGIVYLNLHYRSPAWSTPDETCPAYSSYRRDPDTWLRDVKGVETAEERDWLKRRVFVPEAQRCTVAEWLEWELGRTSISQQRSTGNNKSSVGPAAKHGGEDQVHSGNEASTAVASNKDKNEMESPGCHAHHSAPTSTASVTSRHPPCHHSRKTSWADDEVWNSAMDFSTPLVFDEPVVKKSGKKSSSASDGCVGMGKKMIQGKDTIYEAVEMCHQNEENPFVMNTAENEGNSMKGSSEPSKASVSPSISHPTPSSSLIDSFRLLRTISSSAASSYSSSAVSHSQDGTEV